MSLPQYQPLPDSDWEASHPKSPSQAESQCLLEPGSKTSPTTVTSTITFDGPQPAFPMIARQPWVILSLPMAIALLISASFYCLSTTPSHVQSLQHLDRLHELQQHQCQQQCALYGQETEKDKATGFWFMFGDGVLSLSTWARVPFRVATEGKDEQKMLECGESGIHGPMLSTVEGETKGEGNVGWQGNRVKELGGIAITMVIVQEQPLANTSGEDDPYSAGTESNDDDNDSGDEDNCNDYDDEDSGDEDEYDEEDKENDSGNDDEENDDEDESEDNAGQEEREDARNIGALIRDEISELVDLVEKASKEFIQRIPVVIQELPVINNIIARGAIEQDMDSVDEESEHEFFEHFPLSLKRRNRVTSASQIDIMTSETNGDDDDDDGDDNDNDYQDEDEYDQFPSNMQHNNDRKRNGGNNSVGGNKNIASKAFPKNKHPGQNTNLGSTGGNGPILLCSSRSCLPSLRDAILSRISVQIHHVMNHLRNQEILTRLMDSTAPQTKMSLMAAQEELVQQLEEYVIKDLRDWVMGIRRNSTVAFRKGNQSKKISKDVSATPEDPSAVSLSTLSLADALDLTDVTVESAGLYLGGDEDDSGNGNQHDFWMANLDLGEDEDDDDEDHEDDDYEGHGDEPSNKINPIMKNKGANKDKKKPSTSSKKHRRTSSSSHLEKRAVSQESPQRLQQGQQQQKQRQQLGSADQYFLSADKLVMQHEWSHWIAHWTHRTKILILSHTLATKTLRDMNQIAVSGENVVRVDQRHWSWNLDKALATVMVASEMLCGGPSSPPSTASLSAKGAITPQAMAKTMSAQRCIDAWRGDLEEILQRTATVA